MTQRVDGRTPECFLVPIAADHAVVYSPTTRRACRVDLSHPLAPQVEAAGLAETAEAAVTPFAKHPERFLPEKLTLFPTNRCGQRCRYCYAQAGTRAALDMPMATARAAVDLAVRAAVEAGRRSWVLAFHGGGEPLLRLSWVQQVVGYARELSARSGLALHAIASTGGLLSERSAEWIAGNFSHLVVSSDVLADVQDAQRPAASGAPTSGLVDRTLRLFDRLGFDYYIRTTVSPANVERLVETAETIASRYACRLWHVEPMTLDSGSAAAARDLFPDMDVFVETFLAAHARCVELGIRLQYSGATLEVLRSTFHCGVADDNFAVTPDGLVTTCLDVLSADHPQAGRYVYGRVRADGELEIDHDKRRRLHQLDVHNIPWCACCFLKYHCAGDCIVRAGAEPLGDRDNDRCRTNRAIAARLLDRTLSAGEMERPAAAAPVDEAAP